VQESEYKGHGLWAELRSAATVIGEIDRTGDAETIRSLDALRELLAISSSFEDGEWILVSDAMLTQVQQSWAVISGHLTNFQASDQQTHLDQAFTQTESLRTQLVGLPRPLAHGPAQANLTRAFNRYREELDASRARIVERLNEVLEGANSRESVLTQSVDELKDELESARSSVATLKERIAQGETRLDSALTANNETFNAGQTSRDARFTEWLSEREKGFGDLAAPHLTSIEQARLAAQKQLEVISDLRNSTVAMSQLAAGDILADQYGEYAKSERTASYVAYGIGVLAALGSIAVILFAFGSIQSELDWQNVTLKFALTAAAGGLAAVAFRFGGQAVRRSTSFKRQELELRALQPFLKDVAGADLAKTAFLERAFGRAWEDPATGKGESGVNDSLMKLIALLVQTSPRAGN
jgi:hypothetical protein